MCGYGSPMAIMLDHRSTAVFIDWKIKRMRSVKTFVRLFICMQIYGALPIGKVEAFNDPTSQEHATTQEI